MIAVHRLDGTQLLVNAELIEFVETTPDTVLTLVGGRKILVRESAAEIRHGVIVYRRITHPQYKRQEDPARTPAAGED